MNILKFLGVDACDGQPRLRHIVIYRFLHRCRPGLEHNRIIKTHVYYLIWKLA